VSAQPHYAQNEKDDWQTPPRVTDKFEEHDPIDLDPCAGMDTGLGKHNLTVYDDGLSVDWFGVVYVNPPYSDKVTWLKRVVAEVESGNVERVYVMTPDSTDVKSWWHDLIAEYANYVWFPRGRIKFYNPQTEQIEGSPPSGSAISCFGSQPPEALLDAYRNGGWLVREA